MTSFKTFRPGELWPDDRGVHINAHGGGVLFHDGVYYWFGEHKIAGGAGWKKRPANQHYRGGFSWQHDQVYAKLHRLQPQAIINGRAEMPEDFHSREGDGALGSFDNKRPWELCTTLAGAGVTSRTSRRNRSRIASNCSPKSRGAMATCCSTLA